MKAKAIDYRDDNSIAKYLPFSSLIHENIVITHDCEYMVSFEIDGIPFETASPHFLASKRDHLNTYLRGLSSMGVAAWSHMTRRVTRERLDSKFDNDFLISLDKKYYQNMDDYTIRRNSLFVTLIYRPFDSKIVKNTTLRSNTFEELAEMQEEHIRAVENIADAFESSFASYGAERLGVYTDVKGSKFSSQLELYNFILSGYWQKVRVPKLMPLDEYLGTSQILVGTETIECRTPTHSRYVKMVEMKDYAEETYPGILNSIMYTDSDFILTQSFSPIPSSKAVDQIQKQINRLKNTGDKAVTQIEDMNLAMNDIAGGVIGYGQYHFTLAVYNDDLRQCEKDTNDCINELKSEGFLPAITSSALEAAYLAQLPANWVFRPRPTGITTLNYAGLSPLHNFSAGKRTNNPWGWAVTMLRTPSGQPLYFNFHGSKIDADVVDKKIPANTVILGQTGTGKTTLALFLLAQAQKYKIGAKLSTVYFDKDRGAELFIRRVGGRYFNVEIGKKTNWNPFALPKTGANILFLNQLVKYLCRDPNKPLSTKDEENIRIAIDIVMAISEPRSRRLSTVLQNIPDGTTVEEKNNSIRKRLARWCYGANSNESGANAWVFDNPVDTLDFNESSIIGIDGTNFLDNDELKAPISMYLLYKMDQIIDGRRFIYIMDECQKWFDDSDLSESNFFADFAKNKQNTIRKENGFGIFMTQKASVLYENKIGKALISQSVTFCYLPDPQSVRADYEGYNLTDQEYDIISKAQPEDRCFLYKNSVQSSVASFDLGKGFDDELAIISGSLDNVAILDEIRAEVGDDPLNWEPIFHKRRKERKKAVVENSLS